LIVSSIIADDYKLDEVLSEFLRRWWVADYEAEL